MADYVSDLFNSTPGSSAVLSDPVTELLNSAPQSIAPTNAVADLLGNAPATKPTGSQINPDQLTALVVAAKRGPGAGRDLSADLTSLNDAELTKIYGPGFDVARDQLYEEAHRQQTVRDSSLDSATDPRNITLDLASGGVSMLGSIIGGSAALGNMAGKVGRPEDTFDQDAARLTAEQKSSLEFKVAKGLHTLGTGISSFADNAGPAILDASTAASDWINSFSTESSKENARLTQFENDYESQNNALEASANIAAGANPTMEGWKEVGKNFLDAGANVMSDPSSLSETVAQGIGSSLGAGMFIGGIEKLIAGSGTYKAAKLAAAIDDSFMAKILGYSTDATKFGVTAGSVGLTEAAGTYQQSLQEVMNTPDGDLMRTSAEFRDLVKSGVPVADAKATVASRVAKEAFFIQLPLAMLSSVMALKFDANPLGLFKEGMENGLAGFGRTALAVGGQGIEETAQSSSGQYAQNQATKDNVDPGQSLIEGVGEQGALGAIGGLGMAGAMSGPGVAISALNGINKETPPVEKPSIGVDRKTTVDSWGADNSNIMTPEKVAMDANQKEFDSHVMTGAQKRLADLEAKDAGQNQNAVMIPGSDMSTPANSGAMTAANKAELRFLRENIDKPENLKAAYGIVNTVNERLPEDTGGPIKSDSTLAAEAAARKAENDAATQAVVDAALAKQKTRDEWVSWIKTTRDSALKSGSDGFKATMDAAAPYVKAATDAAAPYTKRAGEAAAPYVAKAKDAAVSGYQKTRVVAGPYIEAGLNKASDAANKVGAKLKAEYESATMDAETLTRDWVNNSTEASLPDGIKSITAPAAMDTPDDLKGVVQPNVDLLSTVNNIVRGLGDSKIKAREMSDSAILYVQDHVEKMRAALPTLPADVSAQVKKVLASPQLAQVLARVKELDLSGKVGAAAGDIIRMAKLNPTKVNPNDIDRVLKQEDGTYSEEDIKFLKVAQSVSRSLDNHGNISLQINSDEGISLSAVKTSDKKTGSNVEATSRSVQISGFDAKDEDGEKVNHLPSIGELASDVIRGFQSADGTFIKNNTKVSGRQSAVLLKKLATHLINKVAALNTSFDNGGSSEMFESLSPKTRKMIPKGVAGVAKSVAYHKNNANSVRLAKAVWNDANVAVDVYNQLVEAFPESFPDGKLALDDLKEMDKPTPTQATAVVTTEAKPKEVAQAEAGELIYGDERFPKGFKTKSYEIKWDGPVTSIIFAEPVKGVSSAALYGKNVTIKLKNGIAFQVEILPDKGIDVIITSNKKSNIGDSMTLLFAHDSVKPYVPVKGVNIRNDGGHALDQMSLLRDIDPTFISALMDLNERAKDKEYNDIATYSFMRDQFDVDVFTLAIAKNEWGGARDAHTRKDPHHIAYHAALVQAAGAVTASTAPIVQEIKPAGVMLQFKDGLPASIRKKDQAKADKASKFIGRGSKNSSTALYAKAFGSLANTGTYAAGDTVFISAEGVRAGRVEPNFAEIQLAIDAGATIITDAKKYRDYIKQGAKEPFNRGEIQVAEYLETHGYAETNGNGVWTKTEAKPAEEAKPADSVGNLKPGEKRDATPEEAAVVMNAIRSVFPGFLVPDIEVEIENFVEDVNGFKKGGHSAGRYISISQSMMKRFMTKPTEKSLGLIRHEFGHYVDFDSEYPMSESKRWAKAVGEFDAFVAEKANQAQLKHLEYILSYKGDARYEREVFAELFAIMSVRPDYVLENFPLAYELMQEQLKEVFNPNPNATPAEDVSPAGETDEGQSQRDKLPPQFHDTFSETKNPAKFKDLDSLLDVVKTDVLGSDEFVEFVKNHAQSIMKRMNARLKLKTFSKSDKTPLLEKLKTDRDVVLSIRDFAPLLFVNPETGKYDPQILSLVVGQVLDYLSGAHAAAPSLLMDRLEADDVQLADLSKEQLFDYMHSISVGRTVEILAARLPKLLNLEINEDQREGTIRASLEGIIKEALTAVGEMENSLIEIKDVPSRVVDKTEELETETGPETKVTKIQTFSQAIVITKALQDEQAKIGLNGKNSIGQIMNPEDLSGPRLGAPPEVTAQTQSRGGIRLSTTEKEVLKNMESIGHRLATLHGLMSALGLDTVFELLGGKNPELVAEDHPYRRSIEGKNLSITLNWSDAMEIAGEILKAGADGLTEVFYPLGITKVGRHQMAGPNPQNNKLLRHMITPTHSVLDMQNNQEHKDFFWLTVAQASGLAKAEKGNHAQIYAETEAQFRDMYKDAIAQAVEYIKTGTLDKEAFSKGMEKGRKDGALEVAQFDAVMAVAQLDVAKTKNEPDAMEKFETSLAFEFDGLTDGPGHMMVHFGQGLLTVQDYVNLRRVGLFLGEHDMTTNEFYGDKNNKDVYEGTNLTAEVVMLEVRKKFGPQVEALTRFASYFGDFKEGNLTRQSAKPAVTKTVYGSGSQGIANGQANDMLTEFYRAMIEDVRDGKPEDVLKYPEFAADFKTLLGAEFNRETDWTQEWIKPAVKARFTELVNATLATVLSQAAKLTIGAEIIKVTDSLVFVTNVQAEFLKMIFESRLHEMAMKDPKVRKHKTTGEPIYQDLSRAKWRALVKEISAMSASYFNGKQTLAIGSFENQLSNMEFSSNLFGDLRMKSTISAPSEAGVKALPYLTQGRGDAMAMNETYKGPDFPKKSLPVYDGVNVAIEDIAAHNQRINEAAARNWEANILDDVVADLQRFIDSIPEKEKAMFEVAFNTVKKNLSKTNQAKTVFSASKTTAQDMVQKIQEFADKNRARKEAIQEIPRSYNHMAGGNKAVNKGPAGKKMDREEINKVISEKEMNPNAKTKRQVAKAARQFKTLTVTTGQQLLGALAGTKMSKRLTDVVNTLQATGIDVRVVTGTDAQILAHRLDEGVTSKDRLDSPGKGFYDSFNNTIYLMSTDHETLVHELVHFTTFALVRNVYEGKGTAQQQEAVKRLEGLMKEFMGLDLSKASKGAQEAARTAQAQIIKAQARKDAYAKAQALNEFMAWSLSNEALAQELGNTLTLSSAVSTMVKRVVALMKRLMGTTVHDIFSNVLFNTKAILEGQTALPPMVITADGKTEVIDTDDVIDDTDDFSTLPTITPGPPAGGNGGNGNGNSGNPGPPSTQPGKAPVNFWMKLLRKKYDEANSQKLGRRERLKKLDTYEKNAQKAYDNLIGGFVFSQEDRQIFKAIHMILALEMKLDANSLVAMNQVFKHALDNLSPAMFKVDGQNKYDAFRNTLGGTKNAQGVSDSIATFFALSQTNKEFRDALDEMPKPAASQGIQVASFNELVTSLGSVMMRKAVGSISVEGTSTVEALDGLAMSIINQDVEREFGVLRGLMSTFDAADKYTSGKLRQMAEFVSDYAYNIPDEQEVKKAVAQSVATLVNLLDDNRAAQSYEGIKRFTHSGSMLDKIVPVREFFSELIGSDANNKGVIALLDKSKTQIAALRQHYREIIPGILSNVFQTKPDANDRRVVHSVMAQADFSAIYDHGNPNLSFKIFADKAYRDRQIKNLEDTLDSQLSKGAYREVIEKAQQLANFMNTGAPGHQLYANAFAINYFQGDRSETMTKVIDKLVTMYAIDGKPQEDLDRVTEMYAAEPEGMKTLAGYLQALNKIEDAKLLNPPKTPKHHLDDEGNPKYGDPMLKMKLNGYKGYIPNFGAADVQITIEEDQHQDILEKRGFRRVGDYTGEDLFGIVSQGYYVTSTKQTGGYSQGAMQQIQNTYRGVNSGTGLTVNGTASGVIKGFQEVDVITQTLNQNPTLANDKEAVRPVWDETGAAFYERIINPDVIQQYSQPQQDLFAMLGVWAGRQLEEEKAEQFNEALVDHLREIYDNRGADEDGMFIDMRAEARKMRLFNSYPEAKRRTLVRPDPIYAESWNKIPPQTKYYIQEVFPDGFFVRKDQINAALGYPEASIVDMWTGKTRLNEGTQTAIRAVANLTLGKLKNGVSAMTLLQKAEEGVQTTVAAAKDIIVVRSLIIPYLNSQANVFNLIMRGVPNKQIVKGYRDKLIEVEEYNKNIQREIVLKLQLTLELDPNRRSILEDQLKVLDDHNKRISIWPLVEAGQYKTISEGLNENDAEMLKGGLGSFINTQVQKLPEVAQTVVKNGLVSKDTAIYAAANKAVQYGDFIAKSVYFDHLSFGGMKQDDALDKINEEFVNFSVPPGRVRTGLDNLGATFFMTYKMRATKIAIAQMRQNPIRSMIVNTLDQGNNTALHSNLFDQIATGSIDYSLGWEMLWSSPTMNPWAAMMGW